MLTRFRSALLLASLFLLSSGIASTASPTIEVVVQGYQYPQDSEDGTIGSAIANNGTVAGVVTFPPGSAQGFLRYADGEFSPTFAFSEAFYTVPTGVNSSNLVCGYYYIPGDATRGFFYDGAAFTTYDVPGATVTDLTSINDAGDFCGAYADSDYVFKGFAVIRHHGRILREL